MIAHALADLVPAPRTFIRAGTALVDGTVCPTWDWNHRDDLYSVKAGYAGMNVQIACSMDGDLAAIGQVPIPGTIERVRDEGRTGPSNSAWRLRSVHEAFDLGPQLRVRLAECPGPVLLVDDLVDSGWTMTVTARLLRQADAPAVLPLVLALAG